MIEPFSKPEYYANEARCGDDEQPCCMCGRPVNPKAAKWLIIGEGNATFITAEQARTDPQAGCFPVGPDCYRRDKRELKPFLAE